MTNDRFQVEATFTITRDEYVRAIRRHYKTKLRIKRDLVAGVLAILGGIYLVRTSEASMIAWLLLIAGSILIAIVLYATLLLPQIVYSSQSKLKSEYRLSFHPGGIHFQTDAVTADLGWSIYHSWLRDDEFYILYHGTRDMSVVPRRALGDSADDQLAELLRIKLGANIP